MNEDQLRAECDRILLAMHDATKDRDAELVGAISVRNQREVALASIGPDAATFRKIHVIGEMNTVMLAMGMLDEVNSANWYDLVPYHRETELAQRAGAN